MSLLLLLSSSDALTRYHELESFINKRELFLKVLWARRPGIKVPVDPALIFIEGTFWIIGEEPLTGLFIRTQSHPCAL